jgi:hypothetical protein
MENSFQVLKREAENIFSNQSFYSARKIFLVGKRRAGGEDVEITLKPHRFNSLELCEFLMNREVVGWRNLCSPYFLFRSLKSFAIRSTFFLESNRR